MNKIAIIGLGNMGEALLKALIRSGAKKGSIYCSEAKRERARVVEQLHGVVCTLTPEEATKKSDYVVVAVKPQDSRSLLQNIALSLNDKKVVISIMAGITTSNILSMIGKPVKVVRLMPNICAKVGEAAMGITANHLTEKQEMEAVEQIFAPLGKIVEVGEELMDAVTALSGSGPAFFLLFLEAMVDAGVKMGLPRDKAKTLSIQVVKGTVQMLEEEGLHPTLMKEMITSPGGTTMAGLASLEEGALKGTVMRAIEIASKRAKELSL